MGSLLYSISLFNNSDKMNEVEIYKNLVFTSTKKISDFIEKDDYLSSIYYYSELLGDEAPISIVIKKLILVGDNDE